MARTLLAIGAHYDDCIFGIPGILLQAVRKGYRVVILAVVGDYSNWAPVRGREAEFIEGTTKICKNFGAELRYLPYASHRFEVTLQTKQAVAQVVLETRPDIAFMLWPQDNHHDHEVTSTLSKIALRHGDRLIDHSLPRPVQSIFVYDNGPRHTIGFEPNTYVDVTGEFPTAIEWLDQFLSLAYANAPDRAAPMAVTHAKTVLAGYRGFACGVQYAEALWAANLRCQELL